MVSEASEPSTVRWVRWLGVSALVVALDQLTKWVVSSQMALNDHIAVLPVFSWVRWHNNGAAFSMLNDAGGWQRWFFVSLAVVFTAFIIFELRRLPLSEKFMAFVYALILGGALGNMIDRLLLGHVVDFILVHYGGWYFPAFNVADIALSCGAALWIGYIVLDVWRNRSSAKQEI